MDPVETRPQITTLIVCEFTSCHLEIIFYRFDLISNSFRQKQQKKWSFIEWVSLLSKRLNLAHQTIKRERVEKEKEKEREAQ